MIIPLSSKEIVRRLIWQKIKIKINYKAEEWVVICEKKRTYAHWEGDSNQLLETSLVIGVALLDDKNQLLRTPRSKCPCNLIKDNKYRTIYLFQISVAVSRTWLSYPPPGFSKERHSNTLHLVGEGWENKGLCTVFRR